LIQTNGGIVAEASFQLEKGDYSRIESEMKRLNAERRAKQPLDKPSAGSTFKKPAGRHAGELIEKCGLAGYAVGGAQVSVKHCGFIVNNGNASASDIFELIKYVRDTVYEKTGVALVPEVRTVGRFV
jgi:UDP-N-acetylmuramate dehydrogenase